MILSPPTPGFSTPIPQTCANPNAQARVVTAATPPPTEYQGEITQPTTVVVEVVIDGDGSVIEASIYKSSGSAKLDHAALIAARKSTYSPKIVDCDPQRAAFTFRVLLMPPSPNPSPTATSKVPAHR